MKIIFLLLISIYRRFISPFKKFFFPLQQPSCRFYPTCSSYAMTAVSRHGVMRGGFLALKRVLRCHPFNNGGVDYVPENFSFFNYRNNSSDMCRLLEEDK